VEATVEETPLSQQGQAYAQAYFDVIQSGGTEEEAQRAGDRAFDETVAQEISPPDLSGRLADEVLGDVSGLGVDRPAYETGRGTVFEDVTRPSGEGVASVDLLQEEPLGPPPAGFTGPSLPPTPGDVDDDRADQMFEWAAGNVPARQGAWQVDEQGRVFTIDERGVRMSPSGIALDPEQVAGDLAAAQAAEELAAPVDIDDSGAGGVNFDAFGFNENRDYSGGEGGEGATDTTTLAGTESSTLADVITALRSGNFSDALNTLREVTAPAPPPEPAGPPIPSNVVGTGAGGILVDNEGNPVLSTSYGLPGEYVAGTPELPSELLELAAQARGMTVDQLRNEIDIAASNGEMIGTTGLDRQSLEALQQAGYGGRDVGSGSQTVDQALASMQTNEFLTEYLPTIIGALGPPGTGAVLSGINTISRLLSGQTTPGQAITTELLGALARKFGTSPTVLTNILDGKFGDAAANQTKSLIYETLAKESGVDGSVLGIAARELGITDVINPLAAEVDRAVTDVVPDQGFGLPGQVALGIDTVLDPVQEAITSGLGGLGDVLQEAGQGIASGIGTVTTGVGDLIGNLVDAITGGGTDTVVDESGVGGVDDPTEFEFKEDRVYPGDGSVGLPGEELGEGHTHRR
jgi:hypothetical protein